jgi:hypothetical protein
VIIDGLEERDGDVVFRWRGEGRCGFDCVCIGDVGRADEIGIVVRLLLVLPASDDGRAGLPLYAAIGLRIALLSLSSSSRRGGRRRGVEGRPPDRKLERLSEKKESDCESSDVSRRASSVFLASASRSIS